MMGNKTQKVMIVFIVGMMGFQMSNVYAAEAITKDTGSLVLCIENNEEDNFVQDMASLEIPVSLYKVADVLPNGRFVPCEGFEELNLEDVSSQTTAAQWETWAIEAKALSLERKKDLELIMQESKVTTWLPVGLYLISVDSVYSSEYVYNFLPYLVAIPYNYYDMTGNDEWIYNVTSSLKIEKVQRYGALQIQKHLKNYNATLAGAEFVFLVEAELDDKVVFSDVLSLHFDGPGNQTTIVDHLPSGAHVNVSEVYSGASYENIGNEIIKNLVVVADDMICADFSNDYHGGGNGGHSLQNHFNLQEGEIANWQWTQMIDNNQ